MQIDLLFKIAGVGVLVTVIASVLTRTGREEMAMLTTVAGLVIVLWIILTMEEPMEMIRVAGFAIAAAFAAAAVRQMRPEAGMAIALAAGVMLLAAALSRVSGLAQALDNLCRQAQLKTAYVRTILKVMGICFLTDLAASVCRDVQEGGLAERVETVGRVLVMTLAAPMLMSLLEQLLELTA